MAPDLRFLEVNYEEGLISGDSLRYDLSSGLWVPSDSMSNLEAGWTRFTSDSPLGYNTPFNITSLGSGVQNEIRRGCRLYWTQTGFYEGFGIVVGALNNDIEIAEQDDFEFQNSDILRIDYSYSAWPWKTDGAFATKFPPYFNFTPVLTKNGGGGTLAGYTVTKFVYTMDEMYVRGYIDITYDIDTASINSFDMTLPVTSAPFNQRDRQLHFNTAIAVTEGYVAIDASTKLATIQKTDLTTIAVNSNNHFLRGNFKYAY